MRRKGKRERQDSDRRCPDPASGSSGRLGALRRDFAAVLGAPGLRNGTVWLNLGDSYAGSGKGPASLGILLMFKAIDFLA